MKSIVLFAGLIVCVASLPGQAQDKGMRMYKCVDNLGKVYYSDKMNPDCAQATELNRQGVVVKKKEPVKPGQPPIIQAEPKVSKERERRDKALLATYTSEEEIDAARDRSLTLPAQGLKTVELKLDKANQHLTDLKAQADAVAAEKKALPAHLLEEVGSKQKEIASLQAELAQRQAQSDSIRQRFEGDKKRFRELKDGGPTAR